MIGGISGIVTNNLSTRTTETRGNTTRTVIRMYDHEGRERGTISWSERAGANGAKRKKLPYNFKEISAQLMRTTTSDAASRVCAKARRRIAQLMRQKKNGEYDESEVEAALLHAEQMERVAKKRKRNLQTEERAADKIDGKEQIDALEKETENGSGARSEALDDETARDLFDGMTEEDVKKMLKELERALSEIEQTTDDFDVGMDELSEALSGEMEPRDLEEMKKKHRADEQRDIVRADMKYLKSVFDRLAREKAQAKAASALSGAAQDAFSYAATATKSASLSPAAAASAPVPDAAQAPVSPSLGNVDVRV